MHKSEWVMIGILMVAVIDIVIMNEMMNCDIPVDIAVACHW